MLRIVLVLGAALLAGLPAQAGLPWGEPPLATIPVGWGAYGLAVDPATSRVYVAVWATGEVVVLEPLAGTILGRIGGFQGPLGLAMDPVLRRLYVAERDGGAVAAVDVDAGTIVARSPVVGRPADPRVDPLTHAVFVSSRDPWGIARLDPVTLQPLAWAEVPFFGPIELDPVLQRVIVPDRAAIRILDPMLATVTSFPAPATLTLHAVPHPVTHDLTVTAMWDRAYRLDAAMTPVASLRGTFSPLVAATGPLRNVAYVTQWWTRHSDPPGWVAVMDWDGPGVVREVRTGSWPWNIVLHPTLPRGYTADWAGGTVTVFATCMDEALRVGCG